MDSDINIEEYIMPDHPPMDEIFTDFSQVKIEVHGGDVAEKLIENLPDHTEVQEEYITEYQTYPEADAESYIEVSDDYPEQIPEDYTVNYPEEHGIQDYADNLAMSIKEEVDPFEGTDYTDFNGVPAEIPNDDLPPEDIYHFHNKIILGSKPCVISTEVSLQQDIEVDGEIESVDVYQSDIEKVHQVAIVLLEDWSVHLKQSLSFCKKCDILFSTPNALDAHNMTTHSFLVAVSKNVAVKSTTKPAFAKKSTSPFKNIARKSTGSKNLLTSKFCNHCNMVFSDHTALIKHLYELLPLNQFNCKICDAVFNTQKDLIDHNAVHIKLEKNKVKKEKVSKEKVDLKKKLVYEEDLKKRRPVSPRKEVNTIPMSVLFQCTKCNVHFLNAFAGWQHFINCNPERTTKRVVSCKTCKRKLRDSDIDVHRKQHEICTKFKVYKTTRNLFERTLCKCPKCGVHFNDLTMKPHLRICGKIPTAHCQKCNILIPKSKIEWHSKKHDKQNLKPKDFIIVQHFIQNRTQKRKLAPITTAAKKIKLEHPSNRVKKESPIANKKILKFTESNIKKEPTNVSATYEKEKGDKIKMVNRLKFENGNKVKMYFCKNCNGCCTRDSRRTFHLSKKCKVQRVSERIICQECGLQFNLKTIVPHRRLHRKRNLSIHDIVFYDIGTLKRLVPSLPTYPKCENCKITFFSRKLQCKHICGEDYETCNLCGEKFDNSAYNTHMEFHKLIKTELPKPKIVAKIIPELMKKYESLNMMWNVLYSCSKCDIVTDLYDKAVEHSQTHLNREATSKNIKCYICNLKFDETCWSKHSDLHSRMMIGSKDFNILSYNPHKLLTEEWFQLFDSVSEEQITQMTNKSLYGYERSVKMKLLKDGRSEFTIYSCSNCKVSCQTNEISKHLTSACKSPANICKICTIPFSDVNSLRYHELLHLKGIKKEEFRIVSFAKEKKQQDNKRSTGLFVIYKCRMCKTCMRHKHNIARHKCLTEHRRAKCKNCNQYFHNSFINKHNKEHTLNPEFNKRNLTVEFFDPTGTNIESDDSGDYKPVKRKYKKRNGTKTIAVKTKTAKADTSKAKVETAKVFKCDCGLHFTSLKTIEKHIQTCSPDSEISKENCSKCGLLFPTDVLVSHLCKHHSKNTKIVIELYHKPEESETSFDSVESTSETQIQESRRKTGSSQKKMAVTSTQNCEVKIFKCSECNIYFLTQNTCYKHVYKFHKPIDPRQYIECKLCGLQFTIKSLPLHISRHHQKEFSLDNVLVEEYQPPLDKGPPKIDLYIASDKVQSLQVTSSIEESKYNS